MGFLALALLQLALVFMKTEQITDVSWFWIWSPSILVGGIFLLFLLAFSVMCMFVRK